MKYLLVLFVFVSLVMSCSGDIEHVTQHTKSKQAQNNETISNRVISPSLSNQINQYVDSLDIDIDWNDNAPYQIRNALKNALQQSFEVDTLSLFTDTIELDVFTANEKYAFIRYNIDFRVAQIGVYKIEKEHFEVLLEQTITNGYSHSYVKDINGDGFLDVVTSTYSESGCCMRNLEAVRAYNPTTHAFEKELKFMNPTFYPTEKTVRGVKYGHAGTVPVYKYQWNNFHIDTIEYIHPSDKANQFVKTKDRNIGSFVKNPSKKEVIYALPAEYLEIEGIDWFLDE